MKVKVEIDKTETLFEVLKLEEHTLYKVLIKVSATNPTHTSFLFTGFKNGNYCTLYNGGDVIDLKNIYSLKIIKKLGKTK